MTPSPTTPRPSSTTRHRVGIGLFCSLGLVGSIALASGLESGAVEPEPEALTPDATPTRAFDRLQFNARGSQLEPCHFEAGTRMAYTVHTRTSVELDMSEVSKQVKLGQAGAQQQAAVRSSEATRHDIEREWSLELETLEIADDGTSVLAARIQDRGIRNLESGPTPQATPALASTFLIRVDARCSIREFGWHEDSPLDAVREQQILAAGLGFWAPPDVTEAASYGATAFDNTGSYKASYAYDEGGHITGQVVSFSAPKTQIEVLGSSIDVQLSPGAWFASLSAERDLELSYYGVSFGTHFRSTQALEAELGDFAPQVELDDGGWTWGRAPAADPSANSEHEFDPRLRELSFEDALTRYDELLANGTLSDYGPLLRDWLRANPEQTDRVLAELRAGRFDGSQKARGGIFYALGSANTREADAALIGILASSEDQVRHQISAAHTLAHVATPTAEMFATLREASQREDLHEVERGSIALALGAFARESDSSDPELGASVRAEIGTWLDSEAGAQDNAVLSHSLLAAGNAGHDELVPSIARYIDHEDPTVRRSATHAMRHMSPDAAYPELERSLGDEDRIVRTAALETAAKVARAHAQAPSESLANQAIDSLTSEHLAERGAAIRLLDEAAKHGNPSATEALHTELRMQLEGGDTKQVAMLARGMSGQWKAQD